MIILKRMGILIIWAWVWIGNVYGQERLIQRPGSPQEIYHDLQKLGVVGTVMYVAAHPDDENTRVISWFSRHRKVETVYLSLTRGDGGQNLIGTEMNEQLGVLRTQELLEARRIDGGKQWFSRANDFGYSKTAEETMAIWHKDAVLADVVWAIRRFRPDVIINRFNAGNSGSTHGHHTASAMLALEAFELAGDPKAFPEQLRSVSVWQPRRIYFNTSWWFYGSQEAFDAADKSKLAKIDIGVYEPWSGYSNSEIAMMSRSMHRCQGFGSELYRGETWDYLDLLKGDLPSDPNDPLADIDLSWRRVPGGDKIAMQIAEIIEKFDFRDPSQSVLPLLQLYKSVLTMPQHPRKAQKLKDIAQVIMDCAGIFAEAKTSIQSTVPGTALPISVEITNRSSVDITLHRIISPGLQIDTTLQTPLANNIPWKWNATYVSAPTLSYSTPYWLTEPHDIGMYQVTHPGYVGLPEVPSPVTLALSLQMDGITIPLELPVRYKEVDPAFGERYAPLHVLPPGTITPEKESAIFTSKNPRPIQVKVLAGQDNFKGQAILDVPAGWTAIPDKIDVDIALKGDEQWVTFMVTPPQQSDVANASFRLVTEGKSYGFSLTKVEYPHIRQQYILMPSRMRLIHEPLQGTAIKVGYIMGAGDKLPECLTEAGMEITVLEDHQITPEGLKGFDALIAGVRAYNTRESLKFKQPIIQSYIKEGGVYLVQYNTNRGLVTSPSPLPMTVSRGRVTDELAPITFLAPDHPVMHRPNKIVPQDFDGWVQERGLYFPDKWDATFTPILAAADPGESPSEGMLLIAPYEKGYFIYTGLAFFRQLPAGVPGAYKLITNILTLNKHDGY